MLRIVTLLVGAGVASALVTRERRLRRKVERLGAATLESLLDAVAANNPETGAHVRRVATYALILADAADVNDRERHDIERVALFHDIGKIDGAVSDIVQISTILTEKEREAVRTHPKRGADVLAPLAAFYPHLPEGVLAHHEWWDGSGYPRGLRGEDIPFSARVVAIADTFDAITHSRVYSEAKSLDEANEAILSGRGTQFDPTLVDLFLLPPVQAEIAASMKKALAPRIRRHGRRRVARKTESAPDITFRWRQESPQPRRADR
jgi:HD-GYP domain-containing protein (c-di-GMP phosphodiesterase class II)